MKETVYITGHKNPDSDSICAALAYAEYKNGSGNYNAIPVRLGNVSLETKFILEYFGVEEPMLIDTLRLSVVDLDFDKIAPVSSDISLRMGLNIMTKNNVNSLPVVDRDDKLQGIVTVSDIIHNYIDVWDNTILGKSNTPLDNIIETLSASPINIPKVKRTDIGSISIIAMDLDSIKDNSYENDILICGDRREVHEFIINNNAALMIITGNGKLDEDLLQRAIQDNIAVISTPNDTFTTSRLITQSVPIHHTMTTENLVVFTIDDLVDDVKELMSQSRFRSYPVIDLEKRVVGLISRYHLISSVKKKVILVDHNERSQSVDGLEDSEILEIIDHHRVADVFTGNPVYFRNEPVGSTSTIIASIYFENGRRPSKKIAGILAAAIISDTLYLKSPTSTNTDKMMLDRLAKIADMDVESFSTDMFKAGTSLVGRTPEDLLSQDFKTFNIKEEKVGISQVYTMDPESLSDMKDDLFKTMESKAKENGYSLFLLLLTDIFNESSEIIVVGEHKALVAKAFGETLQNNSFNAPGVLSRKKQVVPPLTNMLSNLV
ncbi:putative manganese-dependent inorganic diphosphatase [Tissierella creatinini]|nr:putative manganese-dependent inorganic diphosphatase [Tissierella creatinini]TJX65276.1 putative manganese-dependent inorganic diphosphatase [Soehngenia saccharolytica]